MEEDPIAMIVLGILFMIALIAGFWKAVQHSKLVRNAKIQEEDGTVHPATRKEQFLIAQHLAHDKGKHFWHIIVAGMIIIAVVILVLKLVVVPRLDL